MLYSDLVERALRLAALAHRGQTRKGTDIPYLSHPCAVCLILQRAGFGDETMLAAALLHDVVEDTAVTRDELAEQFPPPVVELVEALSERKVDEQGNKRPWADRKRDHLAELSGAGLEVRALALADKLHNLSTIAADLYAGEPVWERFNAPREQLLGYYRAVVEQAGQGDARLERLAAACRDVLARLDPGATR